MNTFALNQETRSTYSPGQVRVTVGGQYERIDVNWREYVWRESTGRWDYNGEWGPVYVDYGYALEDQAINIPANYTMQMLEGPEGVELLGGGCEQCSIETEILASTCGGREGEAWQWLDEENCVGDCLCTGSRACASGNYGPPEQGTTCAN